MARPAWVEIDLDALEANVRALAARVAPAGLLAVIKADAYGHGAPVVARALEAAGIAWLGVALLEEGVELRRAGVERPVLVLGPGRGRQIPLYRRYRLTPSISSLEQLDEWARWAAAGRSEQPIHLKVDTGMSRLGLAPAQVPAALAVVRGHPGLRLAGILSHFAEADDPESPRNAAQDELFAAILAGLQAAERRGLLVHMANSAAALHRPPSRFDLVRCGLAVFGYDPAGRTPGLTPVMSVASRLVQVREVPAGSRAGYGGRWQAREPSRIAVAPVGYADGYPWRLGNRAEALVGGRRVPVVGSVTMDMVLLDVTRAGAASGDPVVLLGRQGEEEITAVELAERAGTIPYEILCLLGLRLPRRYLRRGRDIAFDSRFAAERP